MGCMGEHQEISASTFEHQGNIFLNLCFCSFSVGADGDTSRPLTVSVPPTPDCAVL